MLALRLARGAGPGIQVRRLLVAAASAGTGLLLLCTLGYALGHPQASAAAVLRLTWCLPPLAATVYLAVAVARTDPATRPRTGLSAVGLGPARLAALAAVSTAVVCTLGSLAALLLFLLLRGDLPGLPFGGAAADHLAADRALPVPATLTLLALVPGAASGAVAMTLWPRGARPVRVAGGRGGTPGARTRAAGAGTGSARPRGAPDHGDAPMDSPAESGTVGTADENVIDRSVAATHTTAGTVTTVGAPRGADASGAEYDASGAGPADGAGPHTEPGTPHEPTTSVPRTPALDPYEPPPPLPTPVGLPWGTALLAVGLAVETYAGRLRGTPGFDLPGGFAGSPGWVLLGWALTALGLALAGPALTHLCGRVLQAVRPGAVRLLAGRVLQEEARRIGRPLGVVCAVASGAYAAATLHADVRHGPLSVLGAVLVAGCSVATLLTAAVEAGQARVHTTAALLRLGARPSLLRRAAVLRAGALLVVCAPLTWAVAELAAVPLRG